MVVHASTPETTGSGGQLFGADHQSDRLPTEESIRARATGENFPVVMRGMPRVLREDLLALYDYARLVDQVGDDVETDGDGGRLELLNDLSRDLHRIESSQPDHPILKKLALVIRRHDLPLETLERLIEANRRDQSLSSVESWSELIETCTYSANPVGELVLGILGSANDLTISHSNAVCSALQVVEHCQDVREDYENGRIYLPADDMARFGCQPEDLNRGVATPELRSALQLQVKRARGLLCEADDLLGHLKGIGLPLVAAYAAGGLATCDALERHDFDVLSFEVRPRRRDFFRRWCGLCWRAIKSRILG